jgi:hypothetical protein
LVIGMLLVIKTTTRGHKKSEMSYAFIILIEIDLGNPQNVWDYLMGTFISETASSVGLRK